MSGGPSGRFPADAADELQFGEVRDRQSDPETERPPLPPDLDGHLETARVVRSGSAAGARPAERVTTEVFVDLDAFLEMQAHAAEDTSIELGGLLLGRRGEDPTGRPWVMICDSLRARHYRATRGSFRFTHETWRDLNRQRAELPDATEIVGWYHTHPGWGVFLSDQDVFICDHFFAHPDDVAMVIEPTSGDTGLFVRRGTPADCPPRRLGFYHLYSHRRRATGLHAWALFFTGVGTMSNPPAVFPGHHSPPVIVTTTSDGSGIGKSWVALAGALLGAQLAILLAILVMLSGRGEAEEPRPQTDALRIREAVVDDLIGKIAAASAEGSGEAWRETELANEQLRAANLGLLSRVDSLVNDLQVDRRRLQQTGRELAAVREQLAEAQSKLGALAAARSEELAAAEGTTAGEGSTAAGKTKTVAGFGWTILLAGSVVGLGLGWLAATWLTPATRRKHAAGPLQDGNEPAGLETGDDQRRLGASGRNP